MTRDELNDELFSYLGGHYGLPRELVDELMSHIDAHVQAALAQQREEIAADMDALQANYPEGIFGGPVSTDDARAVGPDGDGE
jgi:hypothetical protein